MLLESDSSWLTLAGPYPMLPRLSAPVSGVDCPSVLPRQLLLFASLLSSNNCPFSCPATNSMSPVQLPTASLLGCVVNSHSRPLTTSGYGEIFLSKNPLSGFAPKQTRLLWRPTPIVLHLDRYLRNRSTICQIRLFVILSKMCEASCLFVDLSKAYNSICCIAEKGDNTDTKIYNLLLFFSCYQPKYTEKLENRRASQIGAEVRISVNPFFSSFHRQVVILLVI